VIDIYNWDDRKVVSEEVERILKLGTTDACKIGLLTSLIKDICSEASRCNNELQRQINNKEEGGYYVYTFISNEVAHEESCKQRAEYILEKKLEEMGLKEGINKDKEA
jgi:hypothetical protein